MKTTAECYQALLDKKWLKNKLLELRVHLNAGDVLVNNVGREVLISFDKPTHWKIYEPPKWYKHIPVGGVLCKTGTGMRAIISFNESLAFQFRDRRGIGHIKAVPVPKAQIQIWLDNAPED